MSAANPPAAPAPDPIREPWESLHRQRLGSSLCIWIFLGSEAMLFGGLIMAVVANRALHPQAFAAAGHETDVVLGTLNTAILLTSSLTMAIASEAAQAELRRTALRGFALTLLLGLAFLAVKGFEYHKDITERLVPGPGFPLPDPASQIFFGFYWGMTALHALHMTAGLGVVGWLGWQAWTRRRALRSPAYEVVALYWHLVDIVWVFLYPLFYLGGRS